ncbi:MAG: transposase, partial [Chloroflexota bacterium]
SCDKCCRFRLSNTTVAAILNCQHRIRQTAVAAPVQRWLDRLDKLLADELHLELDENGQLLHLTLLTKRGTYRLCSATDPDATIRNHGGNKQDFAYNVSVLATVHFIREIQVDTGSRPDGDAIPDILRAQQEHHGFYPDKLVYDRAAGRGKIVHQVDQVSHGQTQLVAYPVLSKRDPDTLPHEDFLLSADGLALTCPNGRTTHKKYRSGSGDGCTFRLIAPQCLGCPFLKPCRGSDKTPTTYKTVFISDYYAELERLRVYSQTEAFKEDMKLRPHIERIIAGLVLHNDARHARFRGLEKAGFQAHMCATAYNLKRWVSRLVEERLNKPPRKRRRCGAPQPVAAAADPSRGEVGLVAA